MLFRSPPAWQAFRLLTVMPGGSVPPPKLAVAAAPLNGNTPFETKLTCGSSIETPNQATLFQSSTNRI